MFSTFYKHITYYTQLHLVLPLGKELFIQDYITRHGIAVILRVIIASVLNGHSKDYIDTKSLVVDLF